MYKSFFMILFSIYTINVLSENISIIGLQGKSPPPSPPPPNATVSPSPQTGGKSQVNIVAVT